MSCCPTPASANAAKKAAPPITAPKVHLHVHAADLAATVDFYRRLFGAEPVKLKPGYAKFLPDWAPVNLAISEHAAAGDGALSHLGVQLPSAEAVQEHLHRIRAAGLAARVELGVDCCHANQDKFWVRSPEGIDWEIYVLNHDLEDSQPIAAGAPSACCR